jgi:hypothetical protein
MRRRAVLGGLLVLVAGAAVLLRPRGPEEFPLADRVPADAFAYAGFATLDDFAAAARTWKVEAPLERLEAARPHLAGPVAVYLDRERRPVFLARLTRGAALFAGADLDVDAAVVAENPAARELHRQRRRTLAERLEFRSLGMRGFVDLAALRLPGRLGEFRALGFELDGAGGFRARALYPQGEYRLYLERYVQARRHGAPERPAPLEATWTEHAPRIWEDVRAALEPRDRELVEREAGVLERTFLDGGTLKDFLARLGPEAGIAVTEGPALAAWIELPDSEAARAEAMLRRAVADGARVRKDRGKTPLVSLGEGGRLEIEGIPGPLYVAFGGGRLTLSTRPGAGGSPTGPGALHASASGSAQGTALVRALPDHWRERLEPAARLLEGWTLAGRFTGQGLEFEGRRR